MAIVRCPMCFQEKEEARRQPLGGIVFCTGCAIDTGRILGFLEFSGFLVMVKDHYEALVHAGDGTGYVPADMPADQAPDEEPPKPPTESKDEEKETNVITGATRPAKDRPAKP